MRKALVDAIGNRAVVIKRSKDVLGSVEHVVDAFDVQECFLLSSEGRVGQIFCGGRRAHCKRGMGIVFGEFGVRITNLFFQGRLKWRIGNEFAHHFAGTRQRLEVFNIQFCHGLVDFGCQVIVIKKIAERLSGCCKATRHPHAGLG